MVSFYFRIRGQWTLIRLTLTEPVVSDCVGGNTEEGYSRSHYSFRLCGDGVILETETSARDCDGRHHTYSERYCPISDLTAIDVGGGIKVPKWGPMPR